MDCSTPVFSVLHSPGVCSNSCPLSQWCHPTITSSAALFSSCSQSFPESGSFQMSPCFTSGGQSIGASTLASVLPMNTQGWFPLGLTGLISMLSKELSRVFSSTVNLPTWLEEPTHWKRPWYWERLKAGGEGGNRGWDGWMASQTQLKWVWANSRRWWWTGKPDVLQSMGSQWVRHNWATEQQQIEKKELLSKLFLAEIS